MNIKTLKTVSLVALTAAFFLPMAVMASQPPTEEEQRDPTGAKKVGKETATVIGHVEEAGRDFAHAFKKQRHKDKKKDKNHK